MPDLDLLDTLRVTYAEIVATAAHGAVGQRRKYTNEPYIEHPRAVVELVKSAKFVDADMVCVAWLHDVVEDTQIESEQINAWFGSAIADMVWYLTDPPRPGRPRRERFEGNMKRLKAARPGTKTVKICDLIDNTSTIVKHDPDFAKLYLSEKKELLETALQGGDEELWQRAYGQCVDGLAKLS